MDIKTIKKNYEKLDRESILIAFGVGVAFTFALDSILLGMMFGILFGFVFEKNRSKKK